MLWPSTPYRRPGRTDSLPLCLAELPAGADDEDGPAQPAVGDADVADADDPAAPHAAVVAQFDELPIESRRWYSAGVQAAAVLGRAAAFRPILSRTHCTSTWPGSDWGALAPHQEFRRSPSPTRRRRQRTTTKPQLQT